MKPKLSGGRTLRTKEILLKLYHVPDGLRRLDGLRIEHRAFPLIVFPEFIGDLCPDLHPLFRLLLWPS